MINIVHFPYEIIAWFDSVEKETLQYLSAQVPQLNINVDKPQPWSLYDKLVMMTDEELAVIRQSSIPYEVKEAKKIKLQKPMNCEYHVHVPSFGLMMIRDVEVLEDACTNELQRRLDEGWRLLCVCPPLDKRRPDYILGRGEIYD